MKRGLVFIVLLLFLVSFSFVPAENSTNTAVVQTTGNQNPGDDILVGGCGTVTPGLEDECCENLGYDKWDEDTLKCENETEVEIEIDGRKIMIQEKYKTAIQTQNRLRIYNGTGECPNACVCAGSTMKCEFENGSRIMTIHAGRSGNTIVQVKGVNASTNVTLYKAEEKVFGVFRNNQTREIILPDQVREKIRERIKVHVENSSLELDEEGEYQYEARKRARLFWIIPVREKIKLQINSETGEVIKYSRPWWGWLANDIEEEEEEPEEEGNETDGNETQ